MKRLRGKARVKESKKEEMLRVKEIEWSLERKNGERWIVKEWWEKIK